MRNNVLCCEKMQMAEHRLQKETDAKPPKCGTWDCK